MRIYFIVECRVYDLSVRIVSHFAKDSIIVCLDLEGELAGLQVAALHDLLAFRPVGSALCPVSIDEIKLICITQRDVQFLLVACILLSSRSEVEEVLRISYSAFTRILLLHVEGVSLSELRKASACHCDECRILGIVNRNAFSSACIQDELDGRIQDLSIRVIRELADYIVVVIDLKRELFIFELSALQDLSSVRSIFAFCDVLVVFEVKGFEVIAHSDNELLIVSRVLCCSSCQNDRFAVIQDTVDLLAAMDFLDRECVSFSEFCKLPACHCDARDSSGVFHYLSSHAFCSSRIQDECDLRIVDRTGRLVVRHCSEQSISIVDLELEIVSGQVDAFRYGLCTADLLRSGSLVAAVHEVKCSRVVTELDIKLSLVVVLLCCSSSQSIDCGCVSNTVDRLAAVLLFDREAVIIIQQIQSIGCNCDQSRGIFRINFYRGFIRCGLVQDELDRRILDVAISLVVYLADHFIVVADQECEVVFFQCNAFRYALSSLRSVRAFCAVGIIHKIKLVVIITQRDIQFAAVIRVRCCRSCHGVDHICEVETINALAAVDLCDLERVGLGKLSQCVRSDRDCCYIIVLVDIYGRSGNLLIQYEIDRRIIDHAVRTMCDSADHLVVVADIECELACLEFYSLRDRLLTFQCI